jgi:hypothetical protein
MMYKYVIVGTNFCWDDDELCYGGDMLGEYANVLPDGRIQCDRGMVCQPEEITLRKIQPYDPEWIAQRPNAGVTKGGVIPHGSEEYDMYMQDKWDEERPRDYV